MTITHPLIEIQLRLIRAFQKGYIEALEAGDWQAADYRCTQLHKLCEGLHYLSQSLSVGGRIPLATAQRNTNSWISGIRSISPTHSPDATEKPVTSPPLSPEPSHYEWGDSHKNFTPPSVDEVW